MSIQRPTRALLNVSDQVEAVCVVDRLSPSTDGDALASMRTRRVRLQRLVNRIRDVLDSPYAEASMQSLQMFFLI